MTWADFYLICFAVGIIFSVVSVIGGGSRSHMHMPHFSHGHVGLPHAASGGLARAAGRGTNSAGIAAAFNFVTLTAFLAWFGGTGYLLSRYSGLWFLIGLLISTLVGLAGAAIVFAFLSRVLTAEDESLDPADFDMNGVLGRISVSIRAGGTGEIIYSQQGTRHTCGARSEGGPIPQGSEVVVTRYEKGIAFVRPWSEMSGEDDLEGSSDIRQPGVNEKEGVQ